MYLAVRALSNFVKICACMCIAFNNTWNTQDQYDEASAQTAAAQGGGGGAADESAPVAAHPQAARYARRRQGSVLVLRVLCACMSCDCGRLCELSEHWRLLFVGLGSVFDTCSFVRVCLFACLSRPAAPGGALGEGNGGGHVLNGAPKASALHAYMHTCMQTVCLCVCLCVSAPWSLRLQLHFPPFLAHRLWAIAATTAPADMALAHPHAHLLVSLALSGK